MLFKARTESKKLKILRILNTRMDLTRKEKKYYSNLEKGFEGEVQFDLMTEKLQSDCLILNDLLLETNNTEFQIDSLAIFQETLYLFDVKNYEDDFCYEEDYLLMNSGRKINNPLDQLKRCSSLLRQLLQNLGFHFTVEAYVIFINPEFTLYQSPQNLPFVFPTQLNRFLKKLNTKPSRLINLHKKLADKLVLLHQSESSNKQIPFYEYQQLKKGITCKVCNSFSLSVLGKKIVCNKCGYEEVVASAVMRGVAEFKLLFPNRKITTNEIHEWVSVVESKKRINRILRRNLKVNGVNQWTFFE